MSINFAQWMPNMSFELYFTDSTLDRPNVCSSNGTGDRGNILRIPEAPSTSARSVTRADRDTALDYIAEMTGGLAEMAAAIDSPVLARLLALAEQEARRSLPV